MKKFWDYIRSPRANYHIMILCAITAGLDALTGRWKNAIVMAGLGLLNYWLASWKEREHNDNEGPRGPTRPAV